jgi:hypothetical protein
MIHDLSTQKGRNVYVEALQMPTLKIEVETSGAQVRVENPLTIDKYIRPNLMDCMKFWNREGKDIIAKNKVGAMGIPSTNEMAKTMKPDDFLLEMLLRDCKTFCNSQRAKDSGDKYECGRTRSHIWVHINDERFFMFYIK